MSYFEKSQDVNTEGESLKLNTDNLKIDTSSGDAKLLTKVQKETAENKKKLSRFEDQMQILQDKMASVESDRLPFLLSKIESAQKEFIQIISLFVAVIAFMIPSILIAVSGVLRFSERCGLILLIGVVLLGFVYLIRRIVFPSLKDDTEKEALKQIRYIIFTAGGTLSIVILLIIIYTLVKSN